MRLGWNGTLDGLLACAPFESQVEQYDGDFTHTPAVIMSLEDVLEELRIASREYQLRHALLVERHDDAQMHRDGPPRPDDPRLQPVAFSTWSISFADQLPDGTLRLLGSFELMRGRSDGYERFASLVLQVMRVLYAEARGFREDDLIAMWMLDLYVSARHGLPGLNAEARVRHGEKGWRSLRCEELGQPPTSTEATRTPECADLAPSWYAELEPECFAASALKLKAILLGLGRAAQKCQTHEIWWTTGRLREIVPELNSDSLRKARTRQVGVKPGLRYRKVGQKYEYELRSVIERWPEHADAIEAALSKTVL